MYYAFHNRNVDSEMDEGFFYFEYLKWSFFFNFVSFFSMHIFFEYVSTFLLADAKVRRSQCIVFNGIKSDFPNQFENGETMHLFGISLYLNKFFFYQFHHRCNKIIYILSTRWSQSGFTHTCIAHRQTTYVFFTQLAIMFSWSQQFFFLQFRFSYCLNYSAFFSISYSQI